MNNIQTDMFAVAAENINKTAKSFLDKITFDTLTVIVPIGLCFIACFLRISKILAKRDDERELKDICKEYGYNPKDIVMVRANEINVLDAYGMSKFHISIRELCKEGINGNFFIYNKTGRSVYAKLAFLIEANKDPKDPFYGKDYKDIVCLNTKDLLEDSLFAIVDKDQRCRIKNIDDLIIVGRDYLNDKLISIATEKFGEDAEVCMLFKEKFIEFLNDVKTDKVKFSGKEKGDMIKLDRNSYYSIGKSGLFVYVASKKGLLEEYRYIKINKKEKEKNTK